MKQTGEWIRKNMFYVVVFGFVAIAFFVSTFLYQIILVDGISMLPAYEDHDVVVINKREKNATYNDVIVFKSKENKRLIKRVVACPKDTVVIKDGTLYVNGKVSTVYPFRGIFDYAGILEKEMTLGEDEYIVLGDNYTQSEDSRYEQIGAISSKDIQGRLVDQRPFGTTE